MRSSETQVRAWCFPRLTSTGWLEACARKLKFGRQSVRHMYINSTHYWRVILSCINWCKFCAIRIMQILPSKWGLKTWKFGLLHKWIPGLIVMYGGDATRAYMAISNRSTFHKGYFTDNFQVACVGCWFQLHEQCTKNRNIHVNALSSSPLRKLSLLLVATLIYNTM